MSAVVDVGLLDEGLGVPGFRTPGLAIPRLVQIGTWRASGRRTFVVARRGLPAVRVRLTGQRFDQLVVSHPAAADLVDQLRQQIVHTA
jgi:uncharacterized protein